MTTRMASPTVQTTVRQYLTQVRLTPMVSMMAVTPAIMIMIVCQTITPTTLQRVKIRSKLTQMGMAVVPLSVPVISRWRYGVFVAAGKYRRL